MGLNWPPVPWGRVYGTYVDASLIRNFYPSRVLRFFFLFSFCSDFHLVFCLLQIYTPLDCLGEGHSALGASLAGQSMVTIIERVCWTVAVIVVS